MAELKHTLKASTLLESLIAMIITMIAFGIGTAIFLSVVKADSSQLRLKADMIVREVCNTTILQKNFIDEEIESKPFIIQKKITPSPLSGELKVLKIRAVDQGGNTMAELKRLIVVK